MSGRSIETAFIFLISIVAREKERQVEQEKEREALEAQRSPAKQLTKEQRKQRERLVRNYGYDSEDPSEQSRNASQSKGTTIAFLGGDILTMAYRSIVSCKRERAKGSGTGAK